MIVIADDITGAAEMAGIAFSRGQQVRLVCSSSVCSSTTATDGTIVIATDTRSMSAAEAAEETRRIISHLSLPLLISHSLTSGQSVALRTSFLIYKKTDSALRGHVVAELSALMEATGYRRALYLPANPSKGRIIRGAPTI